MSFKSEAQRQRCLNLVKQGKMSQAQYDKYDKATPKKIPARLVEKKKPEKKK